MKRAMIVSLVTASFAGMPLLVGCDQPVSHSDSKSTNPITGTTTTKDQTTYQRPDGSTYTDYSKTKANNNGSSTSGGTVNNP